MKEMCINSKGSVKESNFSMKCENCKLTQIKSMHVYQLLLKSGILGESDIHL